MNNTSTTLSISSPEAVSLPTVTTDTTGSAAHDNQVETVAQEEMHYCHFTGVMPYLARLQCCPSPD